MQWRSGSSAAGSSTLLTGHSLAPGELERGVGEEAKRIPSFTNRSLEK